MSFAEAAVDIINASFPVYFLLLPVQAIEVIRVLNTPRAAGCSGVDIARRPSMHRRSVVSRCPGAASKRHQFFISHPHAPGTAEVLAYTLYAVAGG